MYFTQEQQAGIWPPDESASGDCRGPTALNGVVSRAARVPRPRAVKAGFSVPTNRTVIFVRSRTLGQAQVRGMRLATDL